MELNQSEKETLLMALTSIAGSLQTISEALSTQDLVEPINVLTDTVDTLEKNVCSKLNLIAEIINGKE